MRFRFKVFLAFTLLTLTLGLALGTRKNKAQPRRVPLTILQSSRTILDDVQGKSRITTAPGDSKALYVLDTASGDVVNHNSRNGSNKKIKVPFTDDDSSAVDSQGHLYLANFRNATLQVYDGGGRQLKGFPVMQPTSVAVLADGSIVIASPSNEQLLHLYTPEGNLLRSFGEMKSFDSDRRENEFLNRGKVVVGPSDSIYYVSTYAPAPYAAEFSKGGQLLNEFTIEGEAADFQAGKAKDFLRERKSDITGGVTVLNSATVDQATGHLWVGMNGLSTTSTLYEYDARGTKIREYAFLFNLTKRKQNLTHVKDVVVGGATIYILSWGRLHQFDVSETVAPESSSRVRKQPEPATTWLSRLTSRWASATIVNSPIPQTGCPPAQNYPCVADCPNGSNPTSVNCETEVATRLNIGDVVTQSNCTAKTIDPTPGSSTPGGCSQTVNFCNPNSGGQPITGTISVTVNCNPVPTPTPTPTPTPVAEGCNWCEPWQVCRATGCSSPVVIDTLGNGFDLTDAATGVDFDLTARGFKLRISWTAANSDDAWLALDRNANGAVDDGAELFGNFTPQPQPPPGTERNGFWALGEYDKAAQGGNGDGVIDSGDAVYTSLLLWQDSNHNGISESNELRSLQSSGVESIALDYRESRRQDRHGNEFRYRAKANGRGHSDTGKWAYDVFLLSK
jgi:hypothetical protein